MTPVSKTLIGTAAAGAMTLGAASPAFADWRDRDRDRGGIDAGEIIAGALIIGGIAAIASSADDDDYRGGRYDRYDGYSSRAAVEQCVRIAEGEAYRSGYRRAEVTDIRDVDRTRDGYRIKGRVAVDTGYRGARYGRGRGNDYRGYRDEMRGWDSGGFSCRIERGRVVDLDYSGVRGLR